MKELDFLIHTLKLIYKRPEMYGGFVEHVESVISHIFHICSTIVDSNWTYDLTVLVIQNAKAQEKSPNDVFSIESKTIRKLKWGLDEDQVRKSILKVYSVIWHQLNYVPHALYTGKWIEYLLTDPPILRSPNEVDLIMNTLFRVSLQENYREFVNLYTDKVYKLRGSASIGLHDWNVQKGGSLIDPPVENQESFKNLKTVILKIIGILETKAD